MTYTQDGDEAIAFPDWVLDEIQDVVGRLNGAAFRPSIQKTPHFTSITLRRRLINWVSPGAGKLG